MTFIFSTLKSWNKRAYLAEVAEVNIGRCRESLNLERDRRFLLFGFFVGFSCGLEMPVSGFCREFL